MDLKLLSLKINIPWVLCFAFLQSFTNPRRFIVTKYPTPECAVDFLRLLNDHESDTVVCLDPVSKVESVRITQNFCAVHFDLSLSIEPSSNSKVYIDRLKWDGLHFLISICIPTILIGSLYLLSYRGLKWGSPFYQTVKS